MSTVLGFRGSGNIFVLFFLNKNWNCFGYLDQKMVTRIGPFGLARGETFCPF